MQQLQTVINSRVKLQTLCYYEILHSVEWVHFFNDGMNYILFINYQSTTIINTVSGTAVLKYCQHCNIVIRLQKLRPSQKFGLDCSSKLS